MKPLCATALLFAALTASSAVAQSGPLSLHRSDRGEKLYVLDGKGRILASDDRERNLPTKVVAQVPLTLKALALLSTTNLWNEGRLLFVTAYGTTPDDSKSRIIEYTESGEKKCEWFLPEISAGLDIDTDTSSLDAKPPTIYLTGSLTGSVYSLRLIENKCYVDHQLQPIAHIKGAQRLGPIVVEPQGRIALVADALRGSLTKLDLDRGQSIEVFHALGQPVALLLQPQNLYLYIADAAGRRLLRATVDTFPASAPTLYSTDPMIQAPSGLAFESDGRVIVGDLKSGSLLTVNYHGFVDHKFDLPQ